MSIALGGPTGANRHGIRGPSSLREALRLWRIGSEQARPAVKPILGDEPMPRQILTIARTEALAVAPIPRDEPLTLAAIDAAIRASILAHGGIRGCAAALAQAYGDHPETACPRIQWARQTIDTMYEAARRPHMGPWAVATGDGRRRRPAQRPADTRV